METKCVWPSFETHAQEGALLRMTAVFVAFMSP
jgi:hypothetical protein